MASVSSLKSCVAVFFVVVVVVAIAFVVICFAVAGVIVFVFEPTFSLKLSLLRL